MNSKAFLLTVVLLAFAAVFTVKAQGVPNLKDVEVKVSFESTVNAAAGSSTKGDSRWMLITVTYTPETKGDGKVAKNATVDWFDNLTIKFEIITQAVYNGRDVYALMGGKTTLWSVPGDGERHKEVGFIPPQVLKRYTKLKYSSNEARTIEARISFYNKDQQLLGRAYAVPHKGVERDTAARFSRAETELGVLKLEDVVLSRDKTPWAHVDFDFYDLIKTEGAK